MNTNDQAHREATARRWGKRSIAGDWSPDLSLNEGKVTCEPDRCHAFVDGGDRWARTLSSSG